jgi:hypothetical protein
MSGVSSPIDEAREPRGAWRILLWCLPAWLGCAAFMLAFPALSWDPHGPRRYVALAFVLWLSMAPVATALGLARYIKQVRAGQIVGMTKWFLLMAILVAFALNPVLIAALVVVSN